MAKVTVILSTELLEEIQKSLVNAAVSDPKNSADRTRFLETSQNLARALALNPPETRICNCTSRPNKPTGYGAWQCPECGLTHVTKQVGSDGYGWAEHDWIK
jgi:hypothetical protein